MSGRLKRNYSIAELAAITTPIEATLSVTELPRFVEALAVDQPDAAEVGCRLEITAEDAYKVRICGNVWADVLTQCQRCLNGLSLELSIPVDWRLPDDILGSEDGDTKDLEIRLLDWVEDELQLGIPLFARHAEQDCGGELASRYLANEEEHTPDTVTPFDGLKDLLSKQ